MKTTEEMITVMKSYVDGKEIEFFNGSTWEHTIKPLWDWGNTIYRVKETPEYVPFTFEDWEFLKGKSIKAKDGNWIEMLTSCNDDSVNTIPYERLLRDFTFFPDGSPCGKLK